MVVEDTCLETTALCDIFLQCRLEIILLTTDRQTDGHPERNAVLHYVALSKTMYFYDTAVDIMCRGLNILC